MYVNYFEQIWSRRKANKGASQALWDSRVEEFNSHEPDERLNRIVGC